MPLKKGSRLGAYEIADPLGVGGMGEVYRARDCKLGRHVALKILPDGLACDADCVVRFKREARALAALNHPHIATIYGFETDGATHFLVLELVEGETLADRLRRGRLTIDDALAIGRQIAEAVEAAHARGIIHRDLKPGNVKLTRDGRVKVLDFGLAKAVSSSSCSSHAHPNSGTVLTEMTHPGLILGTLTYMSPEQARGQEVDRRTDVWAFGCCLFECLSGAKPFRGQTRSDLLAEVLRSEPDWTLLPEETPPEVTTLLHRCLEKDPRRRLSSLGDIAITLDESTRSRQPGGRTLRRGKASSPVTVWLDRSGLLRHAPVALVLLAAAIICWLILTRTTPYETEARVRQIRSLAVLPFKDSTQNSKLSGLRKWIPAEIRSKLGPIESLQVVNSPARIEQLVEQRKPEVEIARELGVDGLVMGELHGQGETLSAYVWIVDGATGRALGKQREITASSSKISELPNQVALAVVDELKVQVSTTQRAGIQQPDTQNSDAFLAFQRGRDLIDGRQFGPAADEFRWAYQLDANYTRAWVFLAYCEWFPYVFGGPTNRVQDVFKRLSVDVERFHVQRPDDSALAALRMSVALLYERDWKKMRAIFLEASRGRKTDPDLLHAMLWYYVYVEGHPDQALQAIDQAIALAPDKVIYRIDKAHQFVDFGHSNEALAVVRSLPEEKIQLEDFSDVYLMAGDIAAAKDVATRVASHRPNPGTQCQLAGIHARFGEVDQARNLLQDLEAQAARGIHIPHGWIAASYGFIGDFDAARRWLRKGVDDARGDWSIAKIRVVPMLKLFGKFPWYWELIDDLKLPPLQMDHPDFELEQSMRYNRHPPAPATVPSSP